jgi:cobalamin synthase
MARRDARLGCGGWLALLFVLAVVNAILADLGAPWQACLVVVLVLGAWLRRVRINADMER